jgi:hypothetical protein
MNVSEGLALAADIKKDRPTWRDKEILGCSKKIAGLLQLFVIA